MTITRDHAIRALRILRDLNEDLEQAKKMLGTWKDITGEKFLVSKTHAAAEARLAGYVEGLAALLTTMDEARTNAERTQEVMDALGRTAT